MDSVWVFKDTELNDHMSLRPKLSKTRLSYPEKMQYSNFSRLMDTHHSLYFMNAGKLE